MAEEDIGKLIDEETGRRLAAMEASGYEFPPKASAWDWAAIVLLIVGASALIVSCMTGVIR